MKEISELEDFTSSLEKLRDERAETKILKRLQRLCMGHAGDSKSLGGGLKELRITEGKGYRIYYVENDDIILILYMGHKGKQVRDIEKARELAKEGNEQWYVNQGTLIRRDT